MTSVHRAGVPIIENFKIKTGFAGRQYLQDTLKAIAHIHDKMKAVLTKYISIYFYRFQQKLDGSGWSVTKSHKVHQKQKLFRE